MPFVSSIRFEAFRSVFKVPNMNSLRWFPGHMGLGMKQMQQKMKTVDCVVEVHDSRIPISGRNPMLKKSLIGAKPHILVLNKSELTVNRYIPEIRDYLLEKQNIKNVIFTNCRDPKCAGVAQLVPTIEQVIGTSNRFNRSESTEFNVMIIGVPNVGKSSVINSLRNKYLFKGKATPVGPIAGVTRDVRMKIKVSNRPKIYVLDTPGILTPNIPSVEVGMKLAVCSTFKDTLVGPMVIADYIIYWFNKRGDFRYLGLFDISEPCDNIGILLTKLAVAKNFFFKMQTTSGENVKKPNLTAAAELVIEKFRKGLFGEVMLDADILNLSIEREVRVGNL